jgi:2-iminobutanoate/2-iminopropanoate deaminase
MARRTVFTSDTPSSALFSQSVRVDSLVIVSGIVGVDPATGALAGRTIRMTAHVA